MHLGSGTEKCIWFTHGVCLLSRYRHTQYAVNRVDMNYIVVTRIVLMNIATLSLRLLYVIDTYCRSLDNSFDVDVGLLGNNAVWTGC
jgi:hypothetical protein